MAIVSTQRLPTSDLERLVLPPDVVGKMPVLFPPELQNEGSAELILFLETPNEGIPAIVTASLQGGNGDERVIFLGSEWKRVARELKLYEGDTVSIFLLNNTAWTYLIEVERATKAEQIDIDAMDEDVALEVAPMMMEKAHPNMPVKMAFNLNEPANSTMEFDLKASPNMPVRMAFNLNEPADPNHGDEE